MEMEKIHVRNQKSSNLEFVGIARVYLKRALYDNIEGNGVLTQPPKLVWKRKSIINVNWRRGCSRYALLSILHYDEGFSKHRRNPNKYEEGEGDLNFWNLDVDNFKISDIHDVERLSVLSEDKRFTIRYSDKFVIAPKIGMPF